MAMQARQKQIVAAREVGHRLATREAAVDFRALEMLARGALVVQEGNAVTLMMS